MKTILNFTENKNLNGYRAAIGAMVVRVKTDADSVNKMILKEINLKELNKQIAKGKTHKAATATLIWRAVRAIIEVQPIEANGILMPSEVPGFVLRKLERKLQKRGMSVYTVCDIR